MYIKTLVTKSMTYGGYFDTEEKTKIINKLENEMSDDHFWDNQREAEKTIN